MADQQSKRSRLPYGDLLLQAVPAIRRLRRAAPWPDHGILKKYGIKVVAPNSPWAVKDRLNATNWLIKNAEGERRMYVRKVQEHTIKGFSVTYKEGAEDFVVDKDPGLELTGSTDAATILLSAMNHSQLS